MTSPVHGTIDTRSLGDPAEIPFGFTGEIPDNTIDDNQNGAIDEDDEIFRRHSIGQTFLVTPEQPILTAIRVITRDEHFQLEVGDNRDRPITFRVRVMQWDPLLAHPVDDVHYESEVLTMVQNGNAVEHVIATGGLTLPAGIPLVVFLMQEEADLDWGNNKNAFVAVREGDVYIDGSLVRKINGTLGMEGLDAEPWELMEQLDLAILLKLEGPPTPGPTITLTAPMRKGKLPRNRKIAIRGAAFQGFYPLASYQYRLNKSGWKTGGLLSGSHSTWRRKIGKAKEGRNTIQVRSFDVAGQSSPVVVRRARLRR